VSVLPSVASLKVFRRAGAKNRAVSPMIGFGDPVFGRGEAVAAAGPKASPKTSPKTSSKTAPAAAAKTNSATGKTAGGERAGASVTGTPAKAAAPQRLAALAVKTRSYGDYWTGAGVDRDKLASALPRLADTADELRAVARKVGAADGDVILRHEASEAAVKRAPLDRYRIVYFATHGLVAGDVKGVGEPALAMATPSTPSAEDDGLLTASEVAMLRLNADWVVLSACNTAAGEKPGAEALSGLTRAFLYAGARGLLVSHWTVSSPAATRLTTATFAAREADPAAGRAEALRRAMLSFLDDPSEEFNAYPAYWAPFTVIGDSSGS
jgi:CHAT domain-containing protein